MPVESPFFSVVMPVYNRQDLVSPSIESVLAQTFTDFELVCVDDGSADRSVEVLNNFAAKDKRVRIVVHEKNKGRSAARNTGIKACRGQWICFLDSDDLYFPGHLAKHHELIQANNFRLYATNQSWYEKDKTYPFVIPAQGHVVKLRELITGNFISLNQLSVHRDTVLLLEPESISFAEDLLYMRRLLVKNDLLLVPEVTTGVPFHDNRSLLTESALRIAASNWEAANAFVQENPGLAINKNILSHTALFCTSLLLTAGKVKESRGYFKKALAMAGTFKNPLFYKLLLKYPYKYLTTRNTK